jgi:purine-nucleoside/S-methyl-5'-thioadenosine phosphorylase / adenosine deaminase
MAAVGLAAVVSFPAFPARHGFSTAELGSMGLTGALDPAAVIERRRRLAEAIGFDLDRAALAEQVHGAAVHSFRRRDGVPGGQTVRRTDLLTSDVPGQALLTFHADCYPLLAVDLATGAVGAAHAGWRGTLKGAGEALVRALERAYGSRPSDLQVLIGPGICGDCYQVGPEVVAAFRKRFADAERSLREDGDRARLDLASALRLQLEGAGVAPERIMSVQACTREDSRWFSHRGGRPGRFLSVVVAP